MARLVFSWIIGRQEPCTQVSSQARGRFRLDRLLHALLVIGGNCISPEAQLQQYSLKITMRGLLLYLLLGAASARLAPPSGQLHKPTALSKVHQGGATKKRPASEQLTPSGTLCRNQPVRVHRIILH
jgi:hypothetical protein